MGDLEGIPGLRTLAREISKGGMGKLVFSSEHVCKFPYVGDNAISFAKQKRRLLFYRPTYTASGLISMAIHTRRDRVTHSISSPTLTLIAKGAKAACRTLDSELFFPNPTNLHVLLFTTIFVNVHPPDFEL